MSDADVMTLEMDDMAELLATADYFHPTQTERFRSIETADGDKGFAVDLMDETGKVSTLAFVARRDFCGDCGEEVIGYHGPCEGGS